MKIAFEAHAFEDFNNWAIEDKKLHRRIIDLIDADTLVIISCKYHYQK